MLNSIYAIGLSAAGGSKGTTEHAHQARRIALGPGFWRSWTCFSWSATVHIWSK